MDAGRRALEGVEMTSFWLDRPVFVTGATGLLGSWLVARLLETRADIVCLVRDWVPQSELIQKDVLEKVKIIRGDVRDRTLLERILGEYEVDTVFHLAAQTIVTIANRNPVSTFETNIRGTWNVLEASRRSPTVKQIVVASSDKAYGSVGSLPYQEDAPLQGSHPYDVSKSCADLIAQAMANTYGLPVSITRCGNLYGGGDLNWNRIIPGTIRAVVRGENPVIRSNGLYVRDYFYVEDGVEAYLLLAEKMAENRSLCGQAFNFSYENPMPVVRMVEYILKLMNSGLIPEVRNETDHEIIDQYLCAKKARDVLGWAPKFELENGLRRTIDWYTNYLEHEQ